VGGVLGAVVVILSVAVYFLWQKTRSLSTENQWLDKHELIEIGGRLQEENVKEEDWR
jgi:hypothetical protein